MAWCLNQVLDIKFVKGEEMNIFESEKEKECWLSYYVMEAEMYDFTLFKNKGVEFVKVSKPYLLPELKEYDYFLKFGGESENYTEEMIHEALKKVPHITFVRLIEVDNVKQKENLLII